MMAGPGHVNLIDGIQLGELTNDFAAAFAVETLDVVMDMQGFEKGRE